MEINNNTDPSTAFHFLADHAAWLLALGLDYSPTGWTHTDDLLADLLELGGTADLDDARTPGWTDFGDCPDFDCYITHARNTYT